MTKPMISETLSKTINANSKLVREQAECISKLTTSALPKFDTTRIAGIASLGNTGTH
ncbi:hypothetical protein [Leuconostoc citreum]|uniref:hypothetical protein n=1 Tax=Leuconostoc citreum TaxID=33964 RepID=UPI0021A64860|nr:hypothetical protein [Leuconostoc citreum]